MGSRGSPPARTEERRRTNSPKHTQIGPPQLEANGVDVNPQPPDVDLLRERDAEIKWDHAPPDDEWHPYVEELWERLQRDPSKMWNGPAAMALDLAMCENLSRYLMPRPVGTIQVAEDRTEIVYGKVPINGSEMQGLLKWASARGLYEADRLRIQKEITFFGSTADETAEKSGGIATSITKNRQEALGG